MEAKAHKLTASIATEANYELLFQKLVKRNATYLLAQIEQADTLFSPETRMQIMDVLGYSFGFEDLHRLSAKLTLAATPKVEQAGFRNEWIPFLQQAVAINLPGEDSHIKAELSYLLGFLHQLRAEFDEARHYLATSITTFHACNDTVGEVKALNRFAFVERLCGQPEAAHTYITKALALLTPEHPTHEFTHFNLAVLAEERGDYPLAVSHYERSLTLCKQLKNPHIHALRLGNLGLGYYYTRQFEKAIDCFEQSINSFIEQRDQFRAATMQNNLGIVYLLQEKYERAIELFETAEPIFRAVNDHHHLGLVYLNLGIVNRHLKNFERSQLFFTNSIEYWVSIGSVAQLANTLDELGLTYFAENAFGKAAESFRWALRELDKCVATPELERIRRRIEAHFKELQQRY